VRGRPSRGPVSPAHLEGSSRGTALSRPCAKGPFRDRPEGPPLYGPSQTTASRDSVRTERARRSFVRGTSSRDRLEDPSRKDRTERTVRVLGRPSLEARLEKPRLEGPSRGTVQRAVERGRRRDRTSARLESPSIQPVFGACLDGKNLSKDPASGPVSRDRASRQPCEETFRAFDRGTVERGAAEAPSREGPLERDRVSRARLSKNRLEGPFRKTGFHRTVRGADGPRSWLPRFRSCRRKKNTGAPGRAL